MSKIIDTSEPPKRKGIRQRTPMVVGVVVVLIASGALWWYMAQQKTPFFAEKKSSAEIVSDANDKASQLAATKSLDDANKYYDEQIAGSKDANEKQQLLLGKASVAYNAGNYDVALQAALEADKALSSSGTLAMVAQSYEMKSDKVKALEYYQKALAALPKNEVTNRVEVTLKTKVQELSAQ